MVPAFITVQTIVLWVNITVISYKWASMPSW
uniref:Uncharacterized protein n=1 Tax=Anguilla anguilla TaxID=7936 RepID=A0A0E9SC95_ANGAN